MSKPRVLGLLCAALALALALACGDKTETNTPTTPGAEGAAATPPEDAGVPAEMVKGELPKDYPSDLPIFPGATPTTSLMAGGSGLIVLGTTAPVADVLAHYREQLPAQGWTVDEVGEDPGRISTHKGGRTATISISEGSEGTEIGIAIEGS
jgi:hypothetical protein